MATKEQRIICNEDKKERKTDQDPALDRRLQKKLHSRRKKGTLVRSRRKTTVNQRSNRTDTGLDTKHGEFLGSNAVQGSSSFSFVQEVQTLDNDVLNTSRTRQGDSLREIKIRYYTCGLMVSLVGLSLYSFYVRELFASLALFSMAFFFLALLVLGTLLLWYATEQLANWTVPVSRNVMAFSRRLIAVYARR